MTVGPASFKSGYLMMSKWGGDGTNLVIQSRLSRTTLTRLCLVMSAGASVRCAEYSRTPVCTSIGYKEGGDGVMHDPKESVSVRLWPSSIDGH